MTRPITAGIDGSEESLAALAWAAREAVRRDLPLRVVHAWRFQTHDALDTGDRAAQERWVREAAEEAVRAVRERHGGLDVTTDVPEGDAVETLTAAAARRRDAGARLTRARAARGLPGGLGRPAGHRGRRTPRGFRTG